MMSVFLKGHICAKYLTTAYNTSRLQCRTTPGINSLFCWTVTHQHQYKRVISTNKPKKKTGRLNAVGVLAIALGIGAGYVFVYDHLSKPTEFKIKPGVRNAKLPNYTIEEIKKHNGSGENKDVWVTYKDAVYDVSKYIKYHPGGKRLLEAAGGPLEPFWRLYPQHKLWTVGEILEELRIGNIHPDDMPAYNAEVQRKTYQPVIDVKTYTVDIMLDDGSGIYISLDDLKSNYNSKSAVVSSPCANRPNDVITAKWNGALVRDILSKNGIAQRNVESVTLQSIDPGFEVTLPAEAVFGSESEILLAYEMDGKTLPEAHGFPLRAIVPGAPRSKQIKKLKRIVVNSKS